MAPVRANLAAWAFVAGSMSATCANTPAGAAHSSTGCHRPLWFVWLFHTRWMCCEAHAAQHLWFPLQADVNHLEERDLQFYANAKGGSQQTQLAAPTVRFAASFPDFYFRTRLNGAWNRSVIPSCTRYCGWKLAKRLKCKASRLLSLTGSLTHKHILKHGCVSNPPAWKQMWQM